MAKFNAPVQRFATAATSSGATVLVAAQGAGTYIKVIRWAVVTKTALDIKFVTDSAGTPADVLPAMGFAAGGGFRDGMVRNPGDEEDCLFRAAVNKNLAINLSGSGTVMVSIGYYVSLVA